MAVLEEDAPQTSDLHFRLTEVLRRRVKEVARARGTSEGTTARWLMERGLDWWEGLSREQKASA